jgi:acyl-CoA synthetase (AMP-forming)/AMP-acid ligase II
VNLTDPLAPGGAWGVGCFHPGYIVARAADGDLHFVDRKKNVIRRSGENISAVEVENVLARHPAVSQVAVAPVADPVRGEEVVALIVPAEPPVNQQGLAEDIVRYCLTRLAYYKAPGFVAFVEAIPLTSTEKIQRGALRAAVDVAIAEGRAIDTCGLKKRTA